MDPVDCAESAGTAGHAEPVTIGSMIVRMFADIA